MYITFPSLAFVYTFLKTNSCMLSMLLFGFLVFLALPHDLDFSSPTGNWTQALDSESAESNHCAAQGISDLCFYFVHVPCWFRLFSGSPCARNCEMFWELDKALTALDPHLRPCWGPCLLRMWPAVQRDASWAPQVPLCFKAVPLFLHRCWVSCRSYSHSCCIFVFT